MSAKTALVLGGSLLQADLIQAFQALGARVLVVDQDPACYAVRAGLADEFEPISTRDRAGVLEAARRHGPISAIQTAATDSGDIVAWVAGVLGLPAASYASAITTKNKARMREALLLPRPKFTTLRSDWAKVGFPAVLKPAMLSASRGIRVVRGVSELEEHALDPIYLDGFVLEELLGDSGPSHLEVALDLAVQDGRAWIVNSARRVFSEKIPGLELGHVNPAWPTLAEVPAEVQDLTSYAARLLGVSTGPFKLDLIYDPRPGYGWCLLEAATRWSGSFDHSKTARLARGVDYSRELALFSLEGRWSESFLRTMFRPPIAGAASMTPILEPGRVITQDLKFTYSSSPGVVEVLALAPSFPVDPVTTLAARPLHILATGPTTDAAWKFLEEADATRAREDAAENPHQGGLRK